MSAILFGKMQTQTKTVWKCGIGLEASNMSRKVMYSTLVNVQRNRLNQFIDEEEDDDNQESDGMTKAASIETSTVEGKENRGEGYSV